MGDRCRSEYKNEDRPSQDLQDYGLEVDYAFLFLAARPAS